MDTQPASYTELDLSTDPGAGFAVPMCPDCCWSCLHHEPFAENSLVVWCTKLRGHVPSGATCKHWQLQPPSEH